MLREKQVIERSRIPLIPVHGQWQRGDGLETCDWTAQETR